MSIEEKVDALEERAIDRMIDFLSTTEPTEPQTKSAQIGLGAFASVQRRLTAHNQREALDLMLKREGMRPPLASGSSGGASTS